jgi:hypothetical protein
MKREFGFTQEHFVQLAISVCHANAKHDMGWDVALVMPVELWSGRRLDASLEARLV